MANVRWKTQSRNALGQWAASSSKNRSKAKHVHSHVAKKRGGHKKGTLFTAVGGTKTTGYGYGKKRKKTVANPFSRRARSRRTF